ncbi:hypothetical protein [Granulicella sibirica]|uniref:Uncharacterized protein n=1 Tax=Granulicella sibirica TaxID=2479048 RepID=A0A4V1L5S2_9BACT|nr:hypothetical protein [Granulicella sibirica]RXH56754.1 hypothetical protein GRAN_0064 [Granulicella sibirica]
MATLTRGFDEERLAFFVGADAEDGWFAFGVAQGILLGLGLRAQVA